MTIVRAPRPDSGFVMIRNEVARDNRLSYKAVGLLTDILSRPDNWTTSADRMVEKGQEGRAAILTGFKELREAGYMRTVKRRGEQGQWVSVTYVFDSPEMATPGESETGIAPDVDNQHSDASPGVDDQHSVTESQIPALTREDALFSTDLSPAVDNRHSIEDQLQKKKTVRAPRSTKTALRAMPEDWQPTEAHHTYAATHDLVVSDLVETFTNHHLSKGSKFVDWDRAFSTWLSHAKQWSRTKPAARQPATNGHSRRAVATMPWEGN